MNRDRIRWGIIGCGDVTERKSGPAFSQIEHSELYAVMRRTTDKAKDYARRHNVSTWYDDADALIYDQNVDAVYIATPPGTHAYYALKVAEAGKPAYVEKPMARTYAECRQMVDFFEGRNVPLYVAYYRRRLPIFLKLKELLEKREIGDLLSVRLSLMKAPRREDFNEHKPWRLNPIHAGGGYFYDMASHQLDMLDFLFGPLGKAYGITSNRGGYYEVEDTVQALIELPTGIGVTGEWSFVADPALQRDSFTITGKEGVIRLSTFGEVPLQVIKGDQVESYPFPKPDPIQKPLIQSIVGELRGEDICPSTGITAARINRVMEQIIYG